MNRKIDKDLAEFRQSTLAFIAKVRRQLKADTKKTDCDLIKEVLDEVGVPYDIGLPPDNKHTSLIIGSTTLLFKKGKFVGL